MPYNFCVHCIGLQLDYEEPRDPGPKRNEGKKPPPGPLPGYLWGPGALLTASGTEPPASSSFS